MKKKYRILIAAVVILCALISAGVYIVFRYPVKIKKVQLPAFEQNNMSADVMMSAEDMKEDVDYAVTTLKDVHPAAYKGFSKEQEDAIKSVYDDITKPMKLKDFYFEINKVFLSFKDAHTQIQYVLSENDKLIDLPLVWLSDGLYVKYDTKKLKKGDKILSIGGMNEEQLLKELQNIIPAENIYWIKFKGASDLDKEVYLSHLNLIKDNKVSIDIKRGQEELTMELPLIQMNEYTNEETRRYWIGHSIDKENNLGFFYVDKCDYNDEYKSEVKNFFNEVASNKVKNVVVDLRKNTGGNSMVMNEFMKYIDVNSYKGFGTEIRYSKEAAAQKGYLRKSGYVRFKNSKESNKKVKDKNIIFSGNIYILVSNATFSSANDFGAIFKDNKLGTIVGEPTGNNPDSYGDTLSFQTPKSKFYFSVSYKKWLRPDRTKDNKNFLIPDIIVYTTKDDLINDRDAQLEKIKELIKK